MTWFKKNWQYPILGLFVAGFLWFGITNPTPADQAMGYLGALFFFLMMMSVRLLTYLSERELSDCIAVETVKVDGRTTDCFRFRYATANLRILLFMCVAALPMLLAICYATSFNSIKGDLILAFIPFAIIGLAIRIMMRPGLRVTPNGLVVRGRLKAANNLHHTQQLFIPWDEIAGIDLAFVTLTILTSNGHTSKQKLVPAAFIGIALKDYRMVPASEKVKETLAQSRGMFGFDVLIPAAQLQKDQEISSHYYLVPSTTAILEVLRFYLGSTTARADIGTRMGATNLDATFGPALRQNVKDQTTGELANIYRERTSAGMTGRQ